MGNPWGIPWPVCRVAAEVERKGIGGEKRIRVDDLRRRKIEFF